MEKKDQLLTVSEAATLLGIHKGTLRHWAQAGLVMAVKIGTRGDWRFRKEDLEKLMRDPAAKTDTQDSVFGLSSALIEQSPDAIASSDATGHIVTWNKQAEKLHNRKAKDVLGKPFSSIISVGSKEKIENIVNSLLQGKPSVFFEAKRSLRNGKVINLSIHMASVKDIAGKVVAVVAVSRDITKRIKVEEALHESEARFQASFDQTKIPVSLADMKANWLTFNKAYTKLFGYSEQELKKMHVTQLIYPEDFEKSSKAWEDLLQGKVNPLIQERRYIHKNGSTIYGMVQATLIKRDGVPQYVVTVIEDITQRRQAEQLLKSSEERFRTLIEKSTDVIQLISADGKVLYTSDSIKNILGYTPEELIGQGGKPYLHPHDAERFYKAFGSLLAKPGNTVTVEYRLRHKNGAWVWVEATGVNHLDNPAVKAVVGNFRDITKRKLLEQQKEEFLGIVSHELKTPVTSLKAFTQSLERKFARLGDENSAQILGKMDLQIDKLTSLIQDLLDITPVETGRLKFQKTMFPLDELIQEIIEEIQRTTEAHKIIFRNKTKQTVVADRERIGQVLINFLTNAVKYSPSNSQILVDTSPDKQQVTVSVQDFGLGIPLEQLPHVFDKFYRVTGEAYNTIPGMGLGLNIAAEIIKHHKGKIWAESTLGKGSTFYFSLPFA